jgi:formylglycine-generating enzyme required for sulfatase activity
MSITRHVPFSFCLLILCAALVMPRAGQAAEKAYTNSIGMEFVLIPAGTFQMGSSETDREAAASEKPQHRVTISKPF